MRSQERGTTRQHDMAGGVPGPDLRVLDVRWSSRYEGGRDVSFDDRQAYLKGHLPGAVFVGMIEDLSDPSHPIPDMLAPPLKRWVASA